MTRVRDPSMHMRTCHARHMALNVQATCTCTTCTCTCTCARHASVHGRRPPHRGRGAGGGARAARRCQPRGAAPGSRPPPLLRELLTLVPIITTIIRHHHHNQKCSRPSTSAPRLRTTSAPPSQTRAPAPSTPPSPTRRASKELIKSVNDGINYGLNYIASPSGFQGELLVVNGGEALYEDSLPEAGESSCLAGVLTSLQRF